MSQEEKKNNIPFVALIEDPYGMNTLEISDAQNIMDELDLDQDLDTSDLEQSSASVEEQLEKLAQAISDQEAKETEEPLQNEINPEVDLAAQIAEDQALSEEMAKEESEAEAEAAEAQAQTSVQMDVSEIQSCIEAILFMSDKPLSLDKLRANLGPDYDLSLFQEAIQNLTERYQSVHHGIELVEVGGGYQLRTKPIRASLAQKLVRVQTQKLSSGSMETLAIIAYKQPVMKEEIDKIRGVDSSYFVRGLMDRKMIRISGRSELPGRPMLYSTTPEFLEIFGLKDLSSLPSLREIEQMIPGSQSSRAEDEDPRVKEMRRLVGEMKADKSSSLHYDPKEDEKILKEIRERVTSIPTSTPYLDEVKAAELLAQQQAKMAQEAAQNPEKVSSDQR
jgi:segregation and condensation protein B